MPEARLHAWGPSTCPEHGVKMEGVIDGPQRVSSVARLVKVLGLSDLARCSSPGWQCNTEITVMAHQSWAGVVHDRWRHAYQAALAQSLASQLSTCTAFVLMNLKSKYLLLQAKPPAWTSFSYMVCGDPGSAEHGSPEILFALKKLLDFLFTRFSKNPKLSNNKRIDIDFPRFWGQLGSW